MDGEQTEKQYIMLVIVDTWSLHTVCDLLLQSVFTKKKDPKLGDKTHKLGPYRFANSDMQGYSSPILRYGAALLGVDDPLKSRSSLIGASLNSSLGSGFAQQRGEGNIRGVLPL